MHDAVGDSDGVEDGVIDGDKETVGEEVVGAGEEHFPHVERHSPVETPSRSQRVLSAATQSHVCVTFPSAVTTSKSSGESWQISQVPQTTGQVAGIPS
jgi:hypothetical protein